MTTTTYHRPQRRTTRVDHQRRAVGWAVPSRDRAKTRERGEMTMTDTPYYDRLDEQGALDVANEAIGEAIDIATGELGDEYGLLSPEDGDGAPYDLENELWNWLMATGWPDVSLTAPATADEIRDAYVDAITPIIRAEITRRLAERR